jgi:hypothetical protein
MSETDTKNGEVGGSDAASLLLKTSVNGQLYVAGFWPTHRRRIN